MMEKNKNVPDDVFVNGEFSKQTVVYASKAGNDLKMDIITRKGEAKGKPCVIFMAGGGFTHIDRLRDIYIPYMTRLAEEGFIVATIDYRLGLKDKAPGAIHDLQLLENVIEAAVEDACDATRYLLEHADKLMLDSHCIIISGSSAGGMIALSADWSKRNERKAASVLPSDFQYSGVIGFAGALFSNCGLPKYEVAPAPTMMFHGTNDTAVFYKRKRLGNYVMLGSSNLVDLFALENYPYYIKRYKGKGHEVSVLPMQQDLDEVVWFIRKYIFGHKRYKVDVWFEDEAEEVQW